LQLVVVHLVLAVELLHQVVLVAVPAALEHISILALCLSAHYLL